MQTTPATRFDAITEREQGRHPHCPHFYTTGDEIAHTVHELASITQLETRSLPPTSDPAPPT